MTTGEKIASIRPKDIHEIKLAPTSMHFLYNLTHPPGLG
jgi:hypothetical protein